MKLYDKIKHQLNSFVSFLKYKYRYNKKFMIGITALVFIVIITLSTGLLSTFGRVGFSMNVLNGESIPAEPWYMKLISKKNTGSTDYKVWNGTIATSFSGGLGTEESPYIISNGEELAYLASLSEKKIMINNFSNQLCNNNILTKELSNETLESGNSVLNYSIKNESDVDLLRLKFAFLYSDLTITRIYINDVDLEWTTNSTNDGVSIDTAISLNSGEIVTISVEYSAGTIDENSINFMLYDDSNNEYTGVNQCSEQNFTSGKYFKVTNNIDLNKNAFLGIGSEENPFEGNISGGFYKINNLALGDSSENTKNYIGLFSYINNAVVKDFILENSNIKIENSIENYTGTLVGYATGNSKIYNNGILSGSINVSSMGDNSAYVGGLVGYITGTSVVANSYSFGSINVLGTNNTNTFVAGIVGYRTGTNTSLNSTDPKVFLLVMYGSMSVRSGDYQFVYNGTEFDVTQTPTYCYYLWLGDIKDTSVTSENTYAILKSYDEAVSDGFKAHLNNYRYMVNYYIGNDSVISQGEENGYSDVADWYSSNFDSLYPVLRKHQLVVNNKYMDFKSTESAAISEYGENNYLKVNLVDSSNNNNTKTFYVKITDKDEDNNDYVNRKIILPFNSVSSKFVYGSTGLDNNGYEMIITGWKITNVYRNGTRITKGVSGSTINYNYVLRSGVNGAAKDIDNIYAQGGYYLVPDGVTEVTFSAQWARAIYIRDAYDDAVYDLTYLISGNSAFPSVREAGTGKTPDDPITTLQGAYQVAADIAGGLSMHEFAFVLCGNLHYTPTDGNEIAVSGSWPNTTKWPYGWRTNEVTIMSMDKDNNLEPDYSFYTRNNDVYNWYGIRFDFVNVLNVPQVGTINSKFNTIVLDEDANFEITETAVTDKMELQVYRCKTVKINGGLVDIYSYGDATAHDANMKYIYFGGNARASIVNFGNSSTETGTIVSNKAPVFVIAGGRIETLSSTYLNTVVNISNNVYFYIDGAYINKFYATYNADLNKKAEVTINGSYINYYYAGGHTESSDILSGVVSNINDSRIGELYGGPEFGSISGKSVLNIDGSEIDKLFGSGYGGTQTTEVGLSYRKYDEVGWDYCNSDVNSYTSYISLTNDCSVTNDTSRTGTNKTYCLGRKDDVYGLETGFYAGIYSKVGCPIKSFASYYSSLSIASVDRVVLNVINSTINDELYGGGNKGSVNESIEINLDNTIVNGNVYGGGLSNENETLEVFENIDGYLAPSFVSYTVDSEATYPEKVVYTWSSDTSKFDSGSYVNKNEKLLYSENLDKLGTVNGSIHLNITNSTIKGNVYGGGNLSTVVGNINVNLYGKNNISGEVYGGGNVAKVIGNVDVRLDGGNYASVYAGGNYGEIDGESSITVANATTAENVYGGGNNSSTSETKVYLIDGEITNVYGGANNNGIIDVSHVYTGLLNPNKQTFNPEYPVEEEPEEEEPEEEETEEEYPYLPDVDTCNDRDITFSYYYNRSNSQFDFTIYNSTDVDFVSFQAELKMINLESINTWSGWQTAYDSTTQILSISSYNIWQNYHKTISAGGSFLATASANDGTSAGVFFRPTNGDTNLNIFVESVSITAVGSDGVTYTYETCHDEISSDDPVVEEEVLDNRFVFTRPSEVTELGEVIAENIYGGNNKGGKTIQSDVLINSDKVTVTNVYGGGNLVETDDTLVNITSGTVDNVYGGGNMGSVNNNTVVNIVDSHITNSAYAGGNGLGATVKGNSVINVSGKSIIDGSVFGGGNAAETGTEILNTSETIVNIYGATIKKNIYGGANTSKVWGKTIVNIGLVSEEFESTDITIGGTVFGGGEANAEGSEKYDYTYISVTDGTTINVDASNYDITIDGSIFASGNASSSTGISTINIKNFGTYNEPKKLVSIQRATNVLLDNSSIDISGTTDSTNEYSWIIYSLSRIDDLVLANNSNLFVQSATNMVKSLSSYKIDGDVSELSFVDFNDDGTITKNVDNRLYLVINKAFNIKDTENVNVEDGTFGDVNGMIFLGLYENGRDGLPNVGMYDVNLQTGDIAADDLVYQFTSGSYVMGAHKNSHDITIDGFYTNYADKEGVVEQKVIDPTPEDMNYYQWIIGEPSSTFNIELTASKFATLGMGNIALAGYETANTYFEIVSYNDNNLEDGVTLINPEDIPRVADNDEEALTTFGLKMTQGFSGWVTDGETYFTSTTTDSDYVGTNRYVTSNVDKTPTFDFYLIHSKNILENKKLGNVLIGMLAYVPIDEVTYQISRIYINVIMDTRYYDTNNYESNMTPGKEYELFINTKTNITSNSSLSAYYSLYIKGDKSIYKDGYHRVLASSVKLPINTRITMVDRTNEEMPTYYYYVITEDDYNNVKTEIGTSINAIDMTYYVYPLENFVRMGSTSAENKYDDELANASYYDSSTGVSEEEFIFIVDFSEANIESDILDAELLIELKDSDEYTIYNCLGVSHINMIYNVYVDNSANIDVNLQKDREVAYVGNEFYLSGDLKFIQPSNGSVFIYDTNFIQDKMGLKLTIFDSEGNKVTGTNLLGTIFYINGIPYSARLDGSVRIKVSDLVANVKANIKVDLTNSKLPTDTYKINVEAFGSPDGLYYGLTSSGTTEIVIDIVNELYGIAVETAGANMVIDSETGFNADETNVITYDINYTSQFKTPNIRVKFYRRLYDDTYSLNYEEVDLSLYVSDELSKIEENQYLLTNNPTDSNLFTIHFKDKLKTGTYKIVFELYNDDDYIGEDYSYLFIK